jgi:hypothetical protein
MHVRRFALGVAMAVLLGGMAAAQAAPCTAANCLYVPMIDTQASATAAATSTPVPTAPPVAHTCDETRTPGAAPWLTSYTISAGDLLAACMHAGIGSADSGDSAYAVLFLPTGVVTSTTVPIDFNNPGNTTIPLDTANFPPGALIAVEVVERLAVNGQLIPIGRTYLFVRP